MQKVRFAKMHGLGNDYIYVDTLLYNIEDPSRLARLWSDRHRGIGSDGLVLIGRSQVPGADFTMRIFNADGSEAMMCGNASRCVGRYVYEKGLTSKREIRLLTASGIKTIYMNSHAGIIDSVTVDMGEPVFENPKQYMPDGADLREGTFVSMGNPHYVVFTDEVDAVETEGRELESHPAFPERCNIEFAAMRPGGIRVRVWERGSGLTQACGTGACAVAVAACTTGRSGRESCIHMDGGTLEIAWRETDRHVYMTGPAEFVFEGEIPIYEP